MTGRALHLGTGVSPHVEEGTFEKKPNPNAVLARTTHINGQRRRNGSRMEATLLLNNAFSETRPSAAVHRINLMSGMIWKAPDQPTIRSNPPSNTLRPPPRCPFAGCTVCVIERLRARQAAVPFTSITSIPGTTPHRFIRVPSLRAFPI